MKENVVEISGHKYRYGYKDGQTVYLGPVGGSPELSEEEFLRELDETGPTRIFDGETFTLVGHCSDEHRARTDAKELREEGWKVRVTPAPAYEAKFYGMKWSVWKAERKISPEAKPKISLTQYNVLEQMIEGVELELHEKRKGSVAILDGDLVSRGTLKALAKRGLIYKDDDIKRQYRDEEGNLKVQIIRTFRITDKGRDVVEYERERS